MALRKKRRSSTPSHFLGWLGDRCPGDLSIQGGVPVLHPEGTKGNDLNFFLGDLLVGV